MIRLTSFRGSEFYLNDDLIEKIEATPDTVITTTEGRKYIVRESVQEVLDRILRYRIACNDLRPEVLVNEEEK